MTETPLDDTLNDAQPVDQIGNAAYAAEFRHQRTLQFSLAGMILCVVALSLVLAWVSRRPPVVLVVRVDDVGHAEAVRYDALHFTPRESEIRSRLQDWAIYRYRLLRDFAGKNFPLNYDYLSPALVAKLMPQDQPRLVKILARNEPEEDVQVDRIEFTALNGASGEARIEMVKIVNPEGQSERQPWTVTLKYEVNPVDAAKRDPQYQQVNPLGVTITWFHEDRAFR